MFGRSCQAVVRFFGGFRLELLSVLLHRGVVKAYRRHGNVHVVLQFVGIDLDGVDNSTGRWSNVNE